MKATRNKGKSLYGTAVNTRALHSRYHPECATLRKREAPSAAVSYQSKHTKRDRCPVTETGRKADGHRALNAGRRTAACSHKDANHTWAVEKTVCFTMPTCLPVNERKPLQMWCPSARRKPQSEKEFCLAGLTEQSLPSWLLASPPQLPITTSPKEWITAPFPRTLKGRWISISTAPAHSCHLQVSSLFTLKSHTSSCLLPQDSRRSLLSSTFRQHPVLPAQTILGSHCFCHKTPN